MKNKRYRIYNIILSDIISADADFAFGKLVQEKKFEWWRYTALNWIILTPINVSTNEITTLVLEAYGATRPYFVLEIDINDSGGLIPGSTKDGDTPEMISKPFIFFHKIREPNYIPAWEREDGTKK